MHLRSSYHAQQRGFALAAVLWLLAGLAVLVASISTSMMAMARTNHDLQTRVRLLLAEQRATASLTYVLLTQPMLGIGVNVVDRVLPLDGRVRFTLDGGDQVSVELQDLQGLVALNASSGDDVRQLATACGATQQQAAMLADTLLDYTDADSFKRINGAEAFDYAGQGLAPPRNASLVAHAELWRVMGWAALRSLWQRAGCDDFVSLGSSPVVNLWTAPAPVLRAVGMAEADVAPALADREATAPLQRLSPLLLAFRDRQGATLQASSRFATRSRGNVRVTLTLAAAPLARRFVLSRAGRLDAVPYLLTEQEWVPAKSLAAQAGGADGAHSAVRPGEPLTGYVAAASAPSTSNNVQAFPTPLPRR